MYKYCTTEAAVFHFISGVESACTYTTKPNTEGDQADYQKFKSGVSSGAECQTWCDTTVGDDNNPCVAVDFKGGVCFMFTGPTTLFDNAQCTHYEKSCTPGMFYISQLL